MRLNANIRISKIEDYEKRIRRSALTMAEATAISEIPSGSKSVGRDGRVLFVSQEATTAMRSLDAFVREQNVFVEIVDMV